MNRDGMTLTETRGWLSTLCAYLPHLAPLTLDPALVRHWHEELVRCDPDVAHEIALTLAERAWPTFPTRQAFAELRRTHSGLPLGSIDNAGSARAAARAAANAARTTPTRRSAA